MGWRPLAVVRREHEVRRGAHHGGQRPHHADGTEVGTRDEVEHEHQSHRGQSGTCHRESARALGAAQPEPADHRDRRGVLDEERHTDLHVRDGVEVRELAARDRHDSVGGDHRKVLAQQVPAAAQQDERRDHQHHRGDRHPHRHRGTGGPARLEQALGERAGESE